jgi:hypothetical protein
MIAYCHSYLRVHKHEHHQLTVRFGPAGDTRSVHDGKAHILSFSCLLFNFKILISAECMAHLSGGDHKVQFYIHAK